MVMGADFSTITDDFRADIENIRLLVSAFDTPNKFNPSIRIAAANSATLLLGATFEEFVRAMAQCYAMAMISSVDSVHDLPSRFNATVWQRTMEDLARIRFRNQLSPQAMLDAKAKFDAAFEFCRGDMYQDIYQVTLQNNRNMRTDQINALFNVCGLSNVCSKITRMSADIDAQSMPMDVSEIDHFFNRRNEIAHSLSSASSSGAIQIDKDVDLFLIFGELLCETLEIEAGKF